MRFFLTFLMAIVLVVVAARFAAKQVSAQPPTPTGVGIVLVANTECEVGELVRLDATSSDVNSLKWLITPETPDFAVLDRRAFFSGRAPGRYLIFIAGAKEGEAFSTLHTLTVKDQPRDREPSTPSEIETDTPPPVDREWRELTDSLERLEA